MNADNASPAPAESQSSLVIWLAVLAVAYPLSTGPVVRLCDACHLRWGPLLETVYAPLSFACSHSEPVRDVFMWYIFDFWRATPPKYR